MAAWAALKLKGEGRLPKGLLLFYPLVTIADQDWVERPLEDMRLIGRIAVAYIRRSLGEQCDPASFPLPADWLADLPPTVLVSGSGFNPVQPDVIRLEQNIVQAGVPVVSLDYPGLSHASLHLAAIYGPARRAVDGAARALATVLNV
jgi:acetyl esterase/lipase